MVYILGTKIDDINQKQALEEVERLLSNNKKGYIVTPNPEICLKAEKDRKYQDILNDAYLSLSDGFGLKVGAAVLGQHLKNRIAGSDFTLSLMKLAAKKGWRVFLFGGDDGVASECQRVLANKYGGLKVVGVSSGKSQNSQPKAGPPLAEKLENIIIEAISQTKPDILLVALGAPKQEQWIVENLDELSTVKLAMGVGGTFDFISGKVKRAPRLMRQIGLEWLWRLMLQPSRMTRIYNATLKFMAVVLKCRLRIWFKYRPNVVGLIIKCGCSSVVERLLPKQKIAGSIPVTRSSQCKVLIVEREDEPGHWQIPQGGIDKGESPKQAIIREMNEEIGTNQLKIIKHVRGLHKYKWPKLDKSRRAYRGQKQDLFILEFFGSDDEIKLDEREAVTYRWVSPKEALEQVHECRKEMVAKALHHLE